MAGIEVRAVARNVRMSPQKVRLICDAIKGKGVNEALSVLRFMPQRASEPVAKAVKSAVANAENNLDLDAQDLLVLRAQADEGLSLRRFRAKARGRIGRFRRRATHITVVVAERGG